MIDINILPQKARIELLDFYEFLLKRYGREKRKHKLTKDISPVSVDKHSDAFFDQYNIDLDDFAFNRDELYDR